MRVAFYAPLKPPDHPVPSGDRRMARLLTAALRRGGHTVELASRLRARVGDGDARRQAAIAARGTATAERLIRRYRAEDPPAAWFTYHVYYKAPDWIGPAVCEALGIPYLIAEASHAGKRAAGAWAAGHAVAERAIRRADAIFTINPADAEGLLAVVAAPSRLVALKPFLEDAALALPDVSRASLRADLAERLRLDPEAAWLLAVGMMREGDKFASYRLLGAALERLGARPGWQLVVVGDGPARPAVEQALAPLAGRVRFLGQLPQEALKPLYAAADLFVWPAINEAYGMALLEAQALGLAAVAGAVGGVPAILADGATGLLAAPGDPVAFAAAVGRLLDDPARRAAMGAAARHKVLAEHRIGAAAALIDATLARTVAVRGPRERKAMPRLALIRHAETAWSAVKRLQGHADLPLTAAGRAAAEAWRLPPPVDGFARIASPLRRCRETAELLRPPRAFAVEPRLIEMDFGAWEGRTLAEIHATEGAAAAEREAQGLDFRAPGGESPREVQARLAPWLAALDRDTLAIAHKGIIRALYALASGWPILGKPPHRLPMDALHLFAVAPGGALSIERLNLPLTTDAVAETDTA